MTQSGGVTDPDDNTGTGETDWWKGDGRAEHLIDVALPHEDHDEDPSFAVTPGAGSIVTMGIVLIGCATAIILAFIWAVKDWL